MANAFLVQTIKASSLTVRTASTLFTTTTVLRRLWGRPR